MLIMIIISESPSANVDVKKSQVVIIIIIIDNAIRTNHIKARIDKT